MNHSVRNHLAKDRSLIKEGGIEVAKHELNASSANKSDGGPDQGRVDNDPILAGPQTDCFHCGEPVPRFVNLSAKVAGRERAMCCRGCKAAAEFIEQQGLHQFYEFRADQGADTLFGSAARVGQGELSDGATQWFYLDQPETASDYVSNDHNGDRRITILVDNVYCRSCGWLIEKALLNFAPQMSVAMDVDARSLHITLHERGTRLSDLLQIIDRLGYHPLPQKLGQITESAKNTKQEKLDALRRIAVAGFGMMQVMTFAVAGYFDQAMTKAMPIEQHRFILLVSMLVATVVVFYSGRPFFSNAFRDLSNRNWGMDIPVALAIAGAYCPSVYLVLTKSDGHVYFDSAVMFVFFLSLGRFVEMRARHKMTGGGNTLVENLPITIEVQRGSGEVKERLTIPVRDVLKGDEMSLHKGQTVPFDAQVMAGVGQVDAALITGEPEPVLLNNNSTVFAGSKLISGELLVQASAAWPESSLSKIQDAMRDAERLEAKELRLNHWVARYFVLAILALTAIAAGVWSIVQPDRLLEICLAMLVAACPCAFALAVPLGRKAAINKLKKVGVLLTNNRLFSGLEESLAKQNWTWVFDKTGTLTEGLPKIKRVKTFTHRSSQDCLSLVAAIEQQSNHVLANAFANIETEYRAHAVQEALGQGISGQINGEDYYIGKPEWVASHIEFNQSIGEVCTHASETTQAQIVLANDSQILAAIWLEDAVRSSALPLIQQLQNQGSTIQVLSGDAQDRVSNVCRPLGVQQFFANLLPEHKLQQIQKLQGQGKTVLMVGDGINDVPTLAAADISVALASGSNLAMQSADVVLLHGDLRQLSAMVNTVVRTNVITQQNLLWAITYNAIALPLAALGLLTPWLAAIGMSLSSLLVVLNALRI